jgi:taurine--2-oxoglutarate transaminase
MEDNLIRTVDRATKEPPAPYGQSSPAMGELVVQCRTQGLLVFANFHRIEVGPPCAIADERAREGIDRAPCVVDPYFVGRQ